MGKEVDFCKGNWGKIFDGMLDPVAIVDSGYRFTWVNCSMVAFLGLPKESIVGETCHSLIHGSCGPIGACPLQKLKDDPLRQTIELEIPDRNLWLRVAVDPLFGADGELAGAVHVLTDITAAKQAEHAALLQSRRLELLNRIATSVLEEPDLETVMRDVMREVCRFLDLPRSAVRLFGKPDRLIEHAEPGFLPLDPDFYLFQLQCCSDSGRVYKEGRNVVVDDIRRCPVYEDRKEEIDRVRLGAFVEVPLRVQQQPIGVLFLCRAEPHSWTESEIATAEAVARQLAIAVRHAQVFRDQQELAGRLFSLMNNVPGVVYRGFRDWSVSFVGAEIERTIGYLPEEFLSRSLDWREMIHPDDLDSVKRAFREAVRAGRNLLRVEYRVRHKAGGYRWLSDRRQFIYNGDGSFAYVDGMLFDITARKRAEAEAREAGETFRGLIQASPLAIFGLDLSGNVTFWSQAAERVYGWSEQEVLHRPLLIVPEDKREEFRGLLEINRQGMSISGMEVRRRRKDASLIDISVWTSPLRDDKGNVVSIMVLSADITKRKQMEDALRQSEEQLRHSQKMEAVGRLAGGVAHDFNNLLTAIRGYSDLLLGRLDGNSSMRKDVEEIQRAGERAASLTRQLLAFSRKQMLQPKVLDLNAVVANMDNMLRRLIGEDVDLVTVLTPALWKVQVDPGQIEQVLMNLVVNARDAMPKGGKVTIETANVRLAEIYAQKHQTVQPGPYVMVAVSDTGGGMDEVTKNRLFEPFFTTKEKGKGTGLGLSTVYGIVKQSGGHIWVYSEIGRGSMFKVYFPRAIGMAVETASVEAQGPLQNGQETVLLVEDENVVRELVRDILQENGYTVLAASDGAEALQVWGSYPEQVHLMITDVVMPKMGGRELAESLEKQQAGLKVLYMSGYTDESIVHHGVLDSGIPFLQKPFTPDALLRKVREVLDTPRKD
ncbi:MAG: PAS domain S-box protein [Deltaproteobacteria bacterium]|nr:PAS domain S-box protein [Deltaproteobacteria bacterium]